MFILIYNPIKSYFSESYFCNFDEGISFPTWLSDFYRTIYWRNFSALPHFFVVKVAISGLYSIDLFVYPEPILQLNKFSFNIILDDHLVFEQMGPDSFYISIA